MHENTSPPVHSCIHCVDIVLPGSPEKIHISSIGPSEDPYSGLCFQEQTDWNRLGLSLADIRLRANAGCDFAKYLKDRIEHKMYKDKLIDAVQLYTYNDGSTTTFQPLICLQSSHRYLPNDVLEGNDASRFFVTTTGFSYASRIDCTLTKASGDDLNGRVHISRPVSLDPLSARTVTNISEWMKQCEDERDGYHKICSLSERAYVPTRLIKISGPPDQLQLKLVHGDDVKEYETSKYMALSYCWGGDQPKKLTRGNHDLYQVDIPWETLPRTIQDTAKTASALGFSYIWIDSMCIIQDSKEDKDVEISQMARVYAHATLTVVNKRGDKVTDGFLHPRTLPTGTSSIQLRVKNGETHRITLTFEDASYLEYSSAVNKRGWTMQEYVLSRRRLIVGTWSTEWRCRRENSVHTDGCTIDQYKAMEEGDPFAHYVFGWAGRGPFESKAAESVYNSHFIDAVMFFSVNPEYPSGQLVEDLVCKGWNNIVESYSRRSVTESEDRILAISGIAERFANFIPQRYIAGLWENMMPEALFWSNPFLTLSDRPAGYQGPSWSWISIEGMVVRNRIKKCRCEVLSVEYTLKTVEAPYGAVSSATIHIKGPAFGVEWRYTRSKWSLYEDLSEFRWRPNGDDEEQDHELLLELDAREQSTEWREVILLAYQVPEESYGAVRCGVLLIKVDQIEVGKEARTRFRRLGTVLVVQGSRLPHIESWPIRSYYVI